MADGYTQLAIYPTKLTKTVSQAKRTKTVSQRRRTGLLRVDLVALWLTGITSYKLLPQSKFQDAMSWLSDWYQSLHNDENSLPF
ncbi:MAG: hypothetical protein ACE5FD_19435 [Anaerolineae bacterium]